MSRYTERVEALEQNEKKKKRLFSLIIISLVAIFLAGMFIGARRILGTEGTFDPYNQPIAEPLVCKDSPDQILNALRDSLNNAVNPDIVRMSVYTDFDIPDDSIVSESGNEGLVTELKYIKQDSLNGFKEYYNSFEPKFGESYSDKLLPFPYTSADIADIECVRGKLNDEGNVVDYGSMFYTVSFPEMTHEQAQASVLYNGFGMAATDDNREKFIIDINQIAEIKRLETNCTNFKITAQTDALTGQINNICYVRGYSITLTLNFKGDLAGLGEQTIHFDLNATESHWYTWAGLNITESELSIEKRNVHALEAYRTADDEVTLTWTSSDPSIATVDERGYVKGKSVSDKPVTISASFSYRGHTYTDSCIVYVRKPVKQLDISQKQLSLTLGSSSELSAQIKPKNATIKSILWFSEDESVVTVDENGTVTAVSEGEAKVFAVSADGFFRSSCTVTVLPVEG